MLALYISLLDTEEQISKFEHIYTKYRGLMFYTAKGVLQDSYLAEDAVHETFLDIIRIIDSIRANNEKELSQFLRVMTHHKSVDMVRRCNRQRKSDAEIENFVLSKSDVNAETIVLDKIDFENMVFATSVFAAEARWRNVTKITPIILASTNTYSSVINGSEGTTKIDCTLILYEKNQSGTYSEISRCSSTRYGQKGTFSGTANIKSGTTYKLETIVNAGFLIEECEESHVSDEMRKQYPAQFGGTLHRPDFIFFRCKKQS